MSMFSWRSNQSLSTSTLSSTPPSNAFDSYTVWADSAQVFASFQVIHITENLEVAWVIVVGISTAAHSIYATIHATEGHQGGQRKGGRRGRRGGYGDCACHDRGCHSHSGQGRGRGEWCCCPCSLSAYCAIAHEPREAYRGLDPFRTCPNLTSSKRVLDTPARTIWGSWLTFGLSREETVPHEHYSICACNGQSTNDETIAALVAGPNDDFLFTVLLTYTLWKWACILLCASILFGSRQKPVGLRSQSNSSALVLQMWK